MTQRLASLALFVFAVASSRANAWPAGEPCAAVVTMSDHLVAVGKGQCVAEVISGLKWLQKLLELGLHPEH